MAIVIASMWLHFKLMVFTLIYINLSTSLNNLSGLCISFALTFLITLGRIIHATYIKERKEVEMTFFKNNENELKTTPLNESTTKH